MQKERKEMSKNIFKKVAAFLFVAVLVVPGLTHALANPHSDYVPRDGDCLPVHPPLNELGSITIHVRELELDPTLPPGTPLADDQGNPVRNVPIQIERRTLNAGLPGGFQITPQQMTDIAWINANTTAVAGSAQTARTNNAGVVVFDDLPQGIWLVRQLDSWNGMDNPIVDVDDRFDPFLVGLPTHIADDCYVLDVVVWPKIDRDPIVDEEKEVVNAIDNIQTWTIGANIPFRIGGAVNFTITDTLDSRITYRGDAHVIVRFTGRATNAFRPLTIGTHFTMANPTVAGNETVVMNLTQAGMEYIAANGLLGEGRIEFQFDTTFTFGLNDLTTDALGRLYNDAIINYNNYDYEVDEDYVDILALNILKLSMADRRPLAGATFRIYREATAADTVGVVQIPARFNPAGAAAGTIGVVPLRTADNTPMQGTTDANGLLQFNGINSSEAVNGIFWIREVTPPTGFRVVYEWIPRAVTPAYTTVRGPATDFVITANAASDIVHVNIDNEREGGWRLPETGGTGTIVLTVAGVVLIGGALVLFAGNKKEDEDIV